jgi:hypothetical protein
MLDPPRHDCAMGTGQARMGSARQRSPAAGPPRAAEWLRREGARFAAIFLYLYVVFATLNLHEFVVLRQHGIGFAHYGFALVNALVLAKVVLAAEKLHLGRRFERYPLAYPVLLKSLLFTLLLVAFHVGEHVLAGLARGHGLAESIPAIGGGGITGAVAVGAIGFVVLMPFFALRSLAAIMGAAPLYALIFRYGSRDVAVEVTPRRHGRDGPAREDGR